MEKIKDFFRYYKFTSIGIVWDIISSLYILIFIHDMNQLMWLNIVQLPLVLIAFVKEYASINYDEDTSQYKNLNLLMILIVVLYIGGMCLLGQQAISLY